MILPCHHRSSSQNSPLIRYYVHFDSICQKDWQYTSSCSCVSMSSASGFSSSCVSRLPNTHRSSAPFELTKHATSSTRAPRRQSSARPRLSPRGSGDRKCHYWILTAVGTIDRSGGSSNCGCCWRCGCNRGCRQGCRRGCSRRCGGGCSCRRSRGCDRGGRHGDPAVRE